MDYLFRSLLINDLFNLTPRWLGRRKTISGNFPQPVYLLKNPKLLIGDGRPVFTRGVHFDGSGRTGPRENPIQRDLLNFVGFVNHIQRKHFKSSLISLLNLS